MTEEQIAQGCADKSRDAQRELYVQYSRRVYSICSRYLSDEAAVEDLLQEVFIKLFNSMERFKWQGPGSLRAWISRITVNMALDLIRRQSRFVKVPVNESLYDDDETSIEPGKIKGVPIEEVFRMIRTLPDGYRSVFNMYCIDGFSHKEIAKILGINEKSSSSQLTRARGILSREINKYLKDNE